MTKISLYKLIPPLAGYLFLAGVSCTKQDKEGPFDPMPAGVQSKPSANPNILQVGETLEIFVMEDVSFNGTYKIREKGDIIFPKVGRIQVAGMTPESAQFKIQQTLQGSQLTTATVIADRVGKNAGAIFEEKPKMLVFVTGNVNRPGQHMIALENGNSLYAFEAILIAGGTNSFADERKAYVLRRGGNGTRQKIPLDIRSIRQGAVPDIGLAEGDMIFVPARRFSM